MGRPQPFFIIEFGGATLGSRSADSNQHAEFFASLRKYVIGERSPALQAAQRPIKSHLSLQRKTAEAFVSTKLQIADADARSASRLRQQLQEEAEGVVYSVVLSNELLDEPRGCKAHCGDRGGWSSAKEGLDMEQAFFARGQLLQSEIEGIDDCVRPPVHLGRAWLEEARMMATLRRLPEMHGDAMFERVFGALVQYVEGNSSSEAEPYECIVPAMMSSFCRQAWQAA
eukprot:Skav202546  [mRNA]  locus=scaffold2011:291368:300107:- [translate_table: standard]